MADMNSIDLFFLICAGIGGLLFLLRTVTMFIGGDVDGDLDGDIDGGLDGAFDADFDGDFDGDIDGDGLADADTSFRLLSLQGITAFFMMFGLVGLALSRGASNPVLSVAGGLVAGGVTVWVISKIFVGMKSLQADGTIQLENAVGQEGTVYLTIPESGSGQVRVTVQGALKIFDAVSESGGEIATGESVKVVKVISGNMLVVTKIL